jgi:hypothetical protein
MYIRAIDLSSCLFPAAISCLPGLWVSGDLGCDRAAEKLRTAMEKPDIQVPLMATDCGPLISEEVIFQMQCPPLRATTLIIARGMLLCWSVEYSGN